MILNFTKEDYLQELIWQIIWNLLDLRTFQLSLINRFDFIWEDLEWIDTEVSYRAKWLSQLLTIPNVLDIKGNIPSNWMTIFLPIDIDCHDAL